jgi:hypothetical protein
MKFTLEIDTGGNDAFGDDLEQASAEIARILAEAADSIAAALDANDARVLRDINGNTVGNYSTTDWHNRAPGDEEGHAPDMGDWTRVLR